MHERPVVVVSGGGTGGHLYPALAIADELRLIRPDVRVVFVGARRGLEARVLPERGEEHVLLPVHGIDRAHPLGSWRAVTGLVGGVARALRLLRAEGADLVVVTGGYAGAPAGIAAGLAGVPLVLQEQNSLPGAVTKLLTRWASRIHVAYPEAIARLPLEPAHVFVSGNPVRPPTTASREEARAEHGFAPDDLVVLVVGGSQGSVALNAALLDLARAEASGDAALSPHVRFLWATGRANYETVRAALAEQDASDRFRVLPYFEDMPRVLACADLAVSRAGAMSSAELLGQGLPAILVPLPTSAEGHQMLNARALEDAGAAFVVDQRDLDAGTLADAVTRLTGTPGLLSSMRAAALARALPGGAARIAEDLASLLPPRTEPEAVLPGGGEGKR